MRRVGVLMGGADGDPVQRDLVTANGLAVQPPEPFESQLERSPFRLISTDAAA
jgi:hypothetical protein